MGIYFLFVQILSEWGKLLTTKPPKTFSEAFKHTFGQHMVCISISSFLFLIWTLELLWLILYFRAFNALPRLVLKSLSFGRLIWILVKIVLHHFQILAIWVISRKSIPLVSVLPIIVYSLHFVLLALNFFLASIIFLWQGPWHTYKIGHVQLGVRGMWWGLCFFLHTDKLPC